MRWLPWGCYVLLCGLPLTAVASAIPGWSVGFSTDYQPAVGYGEELGLPGDAELEIFSARASVGYTWVPVQEPPPPGGPPFGTPIVWWENRFSFAHTSFDDGLFSEFTAGQDSFSNPSWFSRAGWRFAERWSVDVIAGLSLPVDDLGAAEAKHLQAQGGIGVTWHPNPRTALGLGLFYQQLTGSARVLPFPTVVWYSETAQHSITLIGPRGAYSYRVARGHHLSAIVRLAGNRFSFTKREVPLYDRDGNVRDPAVEPTLAASAIAIAGGYTYKPIPPLSIAVEVGVTVARRLEFTERADDRTLRLSDGTALDLEPDPGLLLSLSGTMRF